MKRLNIVLLLAVTVLSSTMATAQSATGKQPDSRQQKSSSGGYQCGEKSNCKEMSSCQEARFYLEQCGRSKLDRDGDGIPCENVCGKR